MKFEVHFEGYCFVHAKDEQDLKEVYFLLQQENQQFYLTPTSVERADGESKSIIGKCDCCGRIIYEDDNFEDFGDEIYTLIEHQ